MTAIAAFTLTSPATQGAAPFNIGHAFKKGDVPVPANLWCDADNFSIVSLRTWNDGSLKHAAVIGRVALSANVARQVNLYTSGSAPSAGTVLTAASIQAAAPTASVQCGSYGTVSLSSLLASPVRTFISTKEMVECHYTAKVGTDASLFVTFYVNLYADGRMRVRAIVTNGFLNGSERVQKDCVPTVTIGGTVVFNNGSNAYHHSFAARWDVIGWIGSDPQITPRHDTGYLTRTKLVPNYWKTGASQSAINGWTSMTYTPGANLGFSVTMGGTGSQPDIGPMPQWDALYFTSQANPAMFKVVTDHARAINSYGIAFFDQSTLKPIRISDFPDWSLFGQSQGGGDGLATRMQDGVNNLSWEVAHAPSAGYLAYLLTADYYFYEACALQALTHYLCSAYPEGLGTNRVSGKQNRARGWTYRTLMQAAALYPDALATLYGDLSAWVKGIAVKQVAKYVTNNTTAAAWIGYEDFYGDRLQDANGNRTNPIVADGQACVSTAPWEHHFTTYGWASGVDMDPCDDAGMANVVTYSGYLEQAPVWITGGNSATEYNFGYAYAYSVNVRTVDSTNPDLQHQYWSAANPGVIWTDTYSTSATPSYNTTNNTLLGDSGGSPTQPDSYYGNLMPALAVAADHGKTGALAGWTRITGATNFDAINATANMADTPQWGIVPRAYSQPALLFTPVSGGSIPTTTTTGPSFIWDNTSLIPGAFVWNTIRGHGLTAAQIPSAGTNGPALLYNDIDAVNDPAGTEYRLSMPTPTTSTGTSLPITLYEDSSFSVPAGTPDGLYTSMENVYKNGALAYTESFSAAIGSVVVATVTSVSVSPSTASVGGGGTQQFTATVLGTNNPSQGVTWSVATGGGSINSSGLFTAPSATSSTQTITVRATSTADGTKSGTATITVVALAPTVSGVTVSPSSATLGGFSQQQFSASVLGSNNPAQTVTWSATGGSITTGGLFTAPGSSGSIQTITVRATSSVDGSKSGTATVTIPALAPSVSSVSVSPASGTVQGGSQVQFTSSVIGLYSPSQSVTWSASAGSITSGGLWTAPSTTVSDQFVTIMATSTVDSSKTGQANFTVPAFAKPDAPQSITATAGMETVAVSITAPAYDGGTPITGYIVTASNGQVQNVSGTSATFSIPAFTPVSFTAQAVNVMGAGAASNPSNTVIARPVESTNPADYSLEPAPRGRSMRS